MKPAGTPMADMNSACAGCAYKEFDLPALWAQQRQAAQPQTQTQPQPQTVVPIAAELGPLQHGQIVSTPAEAAQAFGAQPQPQPQPQPLIPSKRLIPIAAADLVAVEDVDIGAVVDEALSKLHAEERAAGLNPPDTGPSSGGISWHTLEETRCWLRAYRALVLGLRKRRNGPALAYGTLFHECLARHYGSGGNINETLKPIEAVRLAGAAEFAEEVRKVVLAQLTNPEFVEEESRTWCPRAIEHNAVAFSEPVKINGKTWRIPFTCRHDMLVHIRQPHEPVPGNGPTDNMYVVDWKCVHEDEMLWLEHGRVRAGDLIGQSGVPLAAAYDLEGHAHSGTRDAAFSDNGVREFYSLRLRSGREVRLTEEHPVWTARGWTKTKDIRAGDFVACAPIGIRGVETISDQEIELLGYFLGDGSFCGDAVSFSTSDEAVLAHVSGLLDQTRSTYGVSHTEGRSAANLRVHHHTPLWKLLKEELRLNDKAATKHVPPVGLNAPARQIRLLLAGLWSTDGCVNQQDCRGDDIRIVYTTISAQLARDVLQLLWRLGIWATSRKYESAREGRSVVQWQVAVAGREDKRAFLQQVGSLMVYRGTLSPDRALAYLEEPRTRVHEAADVLPAELLRPLVAGTMRAAGRYMSWLMPPDKPAVSRWVARSMADDVPALRPLVESVLHWDRVESCTCDGAARTVAVSVGGEIFLSGDGIVTHNTTASMTQDLIKGYLLDGQLMQNCFIFREVEESLFGTLRGFIVTVAAKHKDPGPQSFHRVRDATSDEQLRMFYKTELLPRAMELLRRLTDEDTRKDVTLWPMNRQECVGKFLCPYFDMCAYGETADYYVDEKRILDPKTFVKPPKDYKGCVARPPVEVVTASEEKSAARKSKTDVKKAMAERIVESLVVQLRTQQAFAREKFLTAGHTEKSVHAALIDTCILSFRQSFTASGGVDKALTWPLGDDASVELSLKQRGLSFDSDAGRGQIYWKDIATIICKDWWSLDNLTPEKAAADLKPAPMSAPPAPPAPPKTEDQG